MTDPRLLKHAKALRKDMTDAERRLWYHLRGHRFEGAKFKRQKPIGSFIVDFVCMESRLVIELDGGQHADNTGYDQRRDAWLTANGYRVLRFWNNEVMQNLPGVLERIREALGFTDAPSPPTPLPQAGEGSRTQADFDASHAGEGSRTRADFNASQAGEGSRTQADFNASHAGEGSKTRTDFDASQAREGSKGGATAGLSPLPRAGEGGRRPGEGQCRENKTTPKEVQSRSADREKPNPCIE